MHQYECRKPWTGWVGPRSARCVLIGEAWGREEDEVGGQAFVGAAGKELWRMLGEAFSDIEPELHHSISELHTYGNSWINSRRSWLDAASIAFTNVLAFRPQDNRIPSVCLPRSELPPGYEWPPLAKGLYLAPKYLGEVDRLAEELTAAQPNLIVAMGNTACWATLRATNISQIRGTTTQGVADFTPWKVLPTYHPAGVLYDWSWRPIVVADLMKARYEMGFAEVRRPQRYIIINPTLDDVRNWVRNTLASPPPLLACDTETSLGMIDTIGFSATTNSALVIPFGPHRVRVGNGYRTMWSYRDGQRQVSYWTREEEFQVWSLVKYILESPIPKVFQNGVYDLQYLIKMGIRPATCTEDTMLLHHSMYPELQKGLGFLGSIYTSEPAWKLMRRHAADTEKRDE